MKSEECGVKSEWRVKNFLPCKRPKAERLPHQAANNMARKQILHSSLFILHSSHRDASDFTPWLTGNYTVINMTWRCDECFVKVWWMLRQGVTNVSSGCKGVCNNGTDWWLLRVQKDTSLKISYLRKSPKTRVFPPNSRLADFHAILALFQRIIMRNLYANNIPLYHCSVYFSVSTVTLTALSLYQWWKCWWFYLFLFCKTLFQLYDWYYCWAAR